MSTKVRNAVGWLLGHAARQIMLRTVTWSNTKAGNALFAAGNALEDVADRLAPVSDMRNVVRVAEMTDAEIKEIERLEHGPILGSTWQEFPGRHQAVGSQAFNRYCETVRRFDRDSGAWLDRVEQHGVQESWSEVGISSCAYGCKIYRNAAGHHQIQHNGNYSCPDAGLTRYVPGPNPFPRQR